jgi:hypothetical protein
MPDSLISVPIDNDQYQSVLRQARQRIVDRDGTQLMDADACAAGVRAAEASRRSDET